MDDRRWALALRDWWLALDSCPGPLCCVLIRALADCVSLESDRQARGVHHDKHVFQAAVGLAHQVSYGAFAVAKGESTCWARMDTQLVLDRYAAHFVGLAEGAIFVHQYLGHDEQRNAPHAGRRALDAAQHHVTVGGCACVGTPGEEDLLPEQPIVSAFGHCAGTDLRKVGAGLWRGENHGAGPLAAHHLRKEPLLLIFRPTELE